MQRIIKSKMIQRMVSLFLVMLLVYGGSDGTAFFVSASTEEAEMNKYPEWDYDGLRYTKEYIYLSAGLRGGLKPTGFEIYRAPVNKNNKTGTFKKIGTVEDIEKELEFSKSSGTYILYWRMHYTDNDVKIGQMYAYKVRAYLKSGDKVSYTYFESGRQAACGNEIGKFKCKVVTSTKKKLVLKLTSDKNNGPWVMKKGDDYRVRLVAKESENSEIVEKRLKKNKISRDGKTWYDVSKKGMTIRKGESVYLSFSCDGKEKLLREEEYGYIQMLLYCMRYNGMGMRDSELKMREMRINISVGNAEIGDYDHLDGEGDNGYIVEWDNDEFVTESHQEDW